MAFAQLTDCTKRSHSTEKLIMCNPTGRGSWVEILRVASQLTICVRAEPKYSHIAARPDWLQPRYWSAKHSDKLSSELLNAAEMLQLRWWTWKLTSDVCTDICTWAIIWQLSWHIISKLADCSQTDTSPVRWLSKVYQLNLSFPLSSDCSNSMFCCVHCALEANTPNMRTGHQFRYLCWLVYPKCNCIVRAEHDKHRQNWTWLSQLIFPFSKVLSSNSARSYPNWWVLLALRSTDCASSANFVSCKGWRLEWLAVNSQVCWYDEEHLDEQCSRNSLNHRVSSNSK